MTLLRFLADTNLAARRILTSDPNHALIKQAVDSLLMRGDEVAITAQNLVEFQALATRPVEANGLGLTTAEANEQAHEMEAIFPLLEETPSVYNQWRPRTSWNAMMCGDARSSMPDSAL